jgi:hypothetical protein
MAEQKTQDQGLPVRSRENHGFPDSQLSRDDTLSRMSYYQFAPVYDAWMQATLNSYLRLSH